MNVITRIGDRIYIEFTEEDVQMSITHVDKGISIEFFSQRGEAEGIPVKEGTVKFQTIHEQGKNL